MRLDYAFATHASLAARDPRARHVLVLKLGNPAQAKPPESSQGGAEVRQKRVSSGGSLAAMATHQMTRAFGSLSVSGSRPSSTSAPTFGFCSCMRGQSILGAVAGGPRSLARVGCSAKVGIWRPCSGPTRDRPCKCSKYCSVHNLKGATSAGAGAERRRSVAARGAVAVFAKQNAKQRERLSEKQRQYNKSRKSAVATRMRKVCYCL